MAHHVTKMVQSYDYACLCFLMCTYILTDYFIIQIIGIFEDSLITKGGSDLGLSEKGVLQVLLDVKFATDVLSGGDSSSIGELSGNQKPRLHARRKQDQKMTTSVIRERCDQLLKHLSQRLDPIDWLT